MYCALILLLGLGCAYATYIDHDDHQWMRYSALGEPKQEWAYVDVRQAAHMFYWLYHTTAPGGATNNPLVMWLQGGPGGSGTGFGNFEEIGPLNVQLKPRNTTWLSSASLLFVDNPVGTGYSYVDTDDAYATDLETIAKDLLTLFKAFLQKSPQFQTVPFYIFCESYGGKMTAGFAQVLYQAVQAGEIKTNFKGIALGDSWISPIDSVLSWGPYLYVNSLVDRTGLEKVNDSAVKTQDLVMQARWADATAQWGVVENVVEEVTNGVNFYNILQWGGSGMMANMKHLSIMEQLFQRHVAPLQAMSLAQLMNGPIRAKLKIIPKNVTWGGQSAMVFQKQQVEFMKPSAEIVDSLIDTPLKVVVYSGQLDLIVDTLGTETWVYQLKIADKFKQAARKPVIVGGITNGFVKTAKNFSFYWILKAGHMVPADNGQTALAMLNDVIKES